MDQIYFMLEMYIGQDSGWIYGVNQETDSTMSVQLYQKVQCRLLKLHRKWAKGRKNNKRAHNPKWHTSYIHTSVVIHFQTCWEIGFFVVSGDGKWSSDIYEYIYTVDTLHICMSEFPPFCSKPYGKFNLSSPNLLINSVFQLVSGVCQHYSQS